MFVGDEVLVEVSFAVARERLTHLTGPGVLMTASEDAYSREMAQMTRVGAIGLSKLVRIQARELSSTDRLARVALRWEADGPGGGLFPVLDADITLTPAGDNATRLSIAGSYRPPFGFLGEALDRAILHRVADATIRRFLAQVAVQIGDRALSAEPDMERALSNRAE